MRSSARPELLLDTSVYIALLRERPTATRRAAAREHATARQALRRQPIGDRDLVIASVALAHGLAVAAGNVREFARVPGLRVENRGAA